jgi:hypothetical protein
VEALKCNRCGAPRETNDNFCRRCGHQLTITLPAVSESNLPARSRALPPSLVGSMAVLAVGTGLEWLARRMAGTAAKAAGRALIGADRAQPPAPKRAAPSDDTVTVDEVLYIRKVQLRR